MQVRYCWRCRADVPMLDELEFERWHVVFQRCLKSVKTYRQDHAAGLPDVPIDRLFADARALYSEMTGAPDTHHNAISPAPAPRPSLRALREAPSHARGEVLPRVLDASRAYLTSRPGRHLSLRPFDASSTRMARFLARAS
jgi:hypothetical protein